MKTVKRVLLFFVIFFVSFLLVLILGVAVTPEDQENMPVWVGIALVVVPISLGILIVNKAVPVSAEEKVKRETVNCNLQLVGGLDLAAGSICSAGFYSAQSARRSEARRRRRKQKLSVSTLSLHIRLMPKLNTLYLT